MCVIRWTLRGLEEAERREPKRAIIHYMPAHKQFDPADYLSEVHAWIESGKTLRAYCRQDGKPSYGTVYDWLEADAAQSSRFAHARDIGEQQIAQECLEIADTTQVGEIVTQKADGSSETKSADMIEHRKLRIETRLKLLAKWNPKKYGDKLAHTGADGEGPVVIKIDREEIIGKLIGNRPAPPAE